MKMPQGSLYDAEGNLIWQFDICTEFDCNVEYANSQGCDCKGDFTKEPCNFYGEHLQLNQPPTTVEEKGEKE
jgi:hypothetical protein